MKGDKVIRLLEAEGFTVTPDPEYERGYAVTDSRERFAGRYDLDDTGHFRLGWVPTANGRRDCLSFFEFRLELAVF